MDNTLLKIWDDPNTEYHRWKKPDGQIHIQGTVHYDDVIYSFYLNQQRGSVGGKKGILIKKMRGEISVISHKDGLQLQTDNSTVGANKKAHPKGSVVRYQVVIPSTVNDIIKRHLIEDIVNMKQKHCKAIDEDLAKMPLDLLSPVRAVRKYGRMYLGQRLAGTGRKPPSNKTIEYNYKQLEKLSYLLDGTAMAEVPFDKLSAAYQILRKDAPSVFRMGRDFWEFCHARGLYNGKNPFDTYYCQSGKMSAAPNDVRRKARRPKALPKKVASQIFDDYTKNHVTLDVKYIGFILAHDGFSATTAVTLSKRDFRKDTLSAGSVCVAIEKKDIAGATHNFSRPLSPFASAIIGTYIDCLAGKPKETLLLHNGERKLNTKVLTAYIREKLLEFGLDAREMRADPDVIDGVGIDLLQRNYKHWLEFECGLENDRGAVNFMLGVVLPDTTSDSYRSFTCISGQQYLYAAMKRDKRFLPRPVNAEITITHSNDVRQTTDVSIPSADLERFTEAEIELELAPGEWVELSSDVFLAGTIEIIDDSDKHD